ncbi:bifunctional folylpolyglutamate synthase/dihydrofolate synthase [Halioglobus maricola]|nr:folylpolyglutamate synthase/dihydrofolate synthase family protein [Halioglobus maricola]
MNKPALEDWLQHLENLHPQEMELGLERVRSVAVDLALLPPPCPVITVAGTNGKGSTVAVLESLLHRAGKRAGCFTSPHFLRFNERIRVAGQEASDQEICAAFSAIEAARGDTSLTYFEFATLAALLVFRDRDVDVAVLEVGLGGRLDSSNIVDPSVAVITSIDLDHQAWLGDDRNTIAREKAGIMRPGTPVVIADLDPPPALQACAEALGAAPVMLAGREFSWREEADKWSGQICGTDGKLHDVSGSANGLLPANICAALQAASSLGIEWSPAQLQDILADVRVVGRRQWVELDGRRYLLDVAHNPAAIHKMLEIVDASACNGKVIALFSAMKDKPVAEMVALCGERFDAWFVAEQPDNIRAAGAADLADALRHAGQTRISESKNLRQAFRRAQALMAEGDMLIVFGSFFTVAAVVPLLEKDRNKSEAPKR